MNLSQTTTPGRAQEEYSVADENIKRNIEKGKKVNAGSVAKEEEDVAGQQNVREFT